MEVEQAIPGGGRTNPAPLVQAAEVASGEPPGTPWSESIPCTTLCDKRDAQDYIRTCRSASLAVTQGSGPLQYAARSEMTNDRYPYPKARAALGVRPPVKLRARGCCEGG